MPHRRSLFSRLLRAAGLLLLAAVACSVLAVAAFRWLPVPVTSFMLQDRLGAAAARPAGYRFAHDWVPRREIAPHAALAVVAAEDQNFMLHGGFDLKAIDAAFREQQHGRRLRGASTLSQQVAKNLFLWPGRSWLRKGCEAWFTVLIEVLWPKRRILEVYLNSAEFGRGAWGIEAAAQRFFGKPAARLSRAESALLAAVLPSPNRLHAGRPSAYVRSRQDWVLRQMDQLAGSEHDPRPGWRDNMKAPARRGGASG
jgi:monofunctional biosynthetic peptidoglycan transglycosylase